jgi:tRNA (cmo5U34)-methyltransferase
MNRSHATKPEADNLIPAAEKWAFDAEVTAVFDAMLENSIPGYRDMRRLVTAVGCRFVRPGSLVVDLGASRGDALAPFLEHEPFARYVAVESSAPMRREMEGRFRGLPVEIRDDDLRRNHAALNEPTDLVLSVLTLMFIPVEHRYALLGAIQRSLRPGGALILVEKVLGEDAAMDAMLAELYYEFKADNGYTQEAIARKRLSLEGVLVPLSAEWNRQLLKGAGFRHVECFWRSLNFCGLLAVN